jgi:hypothetical protein
VNANLQNLGLEPTLLNDGTLRELIETAIAHGDRVDRNVIRPAISWKPRAKAASSLSA